MWILDSAQGRDLPPFFGDFSQSEKHSEIKPPSACYVQNYFIGISKMYMIVL